MGLDEKKICFIICANDDLFLEECLRYLYALETPEGMEMEVVEIRDAVSMASGYNEGMGASDAKYKVYLHQDVFLINRHFIYDIVDIFKSGKEIGMIGLVGNLETPRDGVMWMGKRVMLGPKQEPWEGYRYRREDGIWDVQCADGLLLATQYDVPWREDLFDGWDFYDVSQSFEMRRRGYRVVVPVQNHEGFIHDDKMILRLWDYDQYRKVFWEEYGEG